MELCDLVLLQLYHLAHRTGGIELEGALRGFPLFYDQDVASDEYQAALRQLADTGMVRITAGDARLTTDGRRRGHQLNHRYCFGEGAAVSAASTADQAYLRRLEVSHGIICLTDLSQRESIVAALHGHYRTAIDIGCGDGTLTDCLRRCSGIPILGIDSSEQLIRRAQQQHPGDYCVHDMDHLDTLEGTFDVVLAIDSLYFSRSLDGVVGLIAAKLNRGGVFLATYSHWVRTQEQAADLESASIPLAKALVTHRLAYEVTDFSAKEKEIWSVKLAILNEQKSAYEHERHTYLYWDRANEAEAMLRMCERGLTARYHYLAKARDYG